MPKEMFSIQGVEVFSAGEWNGDPYSIEDLHGMVKAFNDHKEGLRPFIKIGHDKKQKLLQNDGMPAAGWIERLYVKGSKLIADFVDLPKTVFELIQQKAYRKVSSEIYCGVKIGEQTYPYMLGAVALLGADTPGVGNLSDILSMYTAAGFQELRIYAASDEFDTRTYEFAAEGKETTMPPKSEAEIKLESQLEQAAKKEQELEAKVKEFSAKRDQEDKELAELREFRKSAETEKQKLIEEAAEAKRVAFVDGLVPKKLCTPSMKQFALALIGPEKKEYSFKVGAEEKKLSKEQALEEMLKLFSAAQDVNFEESSSDTEGNKNDASLEAKVEKYMAENKCNYSTAAKAILAAEKRANKQMEGDD